MKLFSVEVQPNAVQWIIPEVPESALWDYLVFDCTVKQEDWQHIQWKFIDDTKPRANFFTLGNHGVFAFDEAVRNSELYEIMVKTIQIIPVNVKGESLFIANVLQCVDSERSASLWPSGLFKVLSTYRGNIFTTDEEFGFIEKYNRFKFNGLIFKSI